MGYQRLDFIIAQIRKTLHFGLITFFDTFLDGFGHLVVFHGILHFWVGVVLYAKFLAHLGFAFAILAMTFGAILGPDRFGIRRPGRQSAGNQEGQTEYN